MVAAVAVALVGVLGYFALKPGPDPRARVGSPAPVFEAETLDGLKVSLKDYRGRPVLLNFWASWCVPCRKEFPLLKQVDESTQVLGVLVDDEKGSARDFVQEMGADWPTALDPNGRIARAYGVGRSPGIPVTVFIDASGIITKVKLGELRRADLG